MTWRDVAITLCIVALAGGGYLVGFAAGMTYSPPPRGITTNKVLTWQ